MDENKEKLTEQAAEVIETKASSGNVEEVEIRSEVDTQEIDIDVSSDEDLSDEEGVSGRKNQADRRKDVLRVGGVLFVICAAVALIVSFVYTMTADVIAAAAEREKQEAIMRIFGENIEVGVLEAPEGAQALYAIDGSGWCVDLSVDGFGGEIDLLVGVALDGTVRGVEIISHSETPGFGAKADDPNYLEQYIGASGELKLGEDILAISGATISSRAIVSGVNNARDLLISMGLITPSEPVLTEEERVLAAAERIFDAELELIEMDTPEGADSFFAADNGGWGLTLTVDGYQSGIKLLVCVDDFGVICGVEVLSHDEGRTFDEDVYLAEYTGLHNASVLRDTVDVVSGATYSSDAVMRGVSTALDIFASMGIGSVDNTDEMGGGRE